jgi:predicted nucleic acid-binding Zn ribbon protein
MPVYVYECEKCGEVVEVVQSIKDNSYILHKEIAIMENTFKNCDGKVKRIIQPAALKFKGKGWTRKFFR